VSIAAKSPDESAPQGARTADRCPDDLIEMLEVGESDALPAWLVRCLAGMFPRTTQRVLRVHPGRAGRTKRRDRYAVFSMAAPVPILVETDAMMVEAIASSRRISIATVNGADRLLVSLAAAGEVRYLVELEGAIDADEANALCGFASIASRYYDRLVDAETDPLTRLGNRRVFHARVDSGMRRWITPGRLYFLAVIDIDRFKRINDTFGHLYGDEILVHFANLMRNTFRAGDQAYRFGGEEFVLVYGADSERSGEQVLERFRAAVESYAFPGVGQVTVSIGFARMPDAATPSTTLIERADQALYYAKENGRNRVCGWDALQAAGKLPAKVAANKEVTLF
jgi:diguanylate cyclase (GGDEF)-like protein